MVMGNLERLSDVTKLSAHVTRVLGQNPGLMTLQGTNSYLLQPPSNPHAPLILIDTSSPHTATQYIDLLFTHLHHLALESGVRETHFESNYAQASLKNLPEDQHDKIKSEILKKRSENPREDELELVEYGPGSKWISPVSRGERKLPNIEHIILTHRHLDHVGALPLLLNTLKKHGCSLPKIWKFPSPDEADLALNERDRLTTDAELWNSLPKGTFHSFSPFQPFHPIIPGLMISIIDPVYKHLLKHDNKNGKSNWNDVPEIARVSLRCLRTPGHTKDSISLVMLEGEKGVFTGDTVLGTGTTHFSDLSSYMTSLRTLLALKPNVLYPAHGPHIPDSIQSRKHIQSYISHRQEREDQILTILKEFKQNTKSISELIIDLKKEIQTKIDVDNKAKGPLMYDKKKQTNWTEYNKVLEGYKDYIDKVEKDGEKDRRGRGKGQMPLSLLLRLIYKSQDEKLLFAAAKSIKSHLEKLENEGKIKKGEKKIKWVRLVDDDVLKGEEEDMDFWEFVGGDEGEEGKEGEEKK